MLFVREKIKSNEINFKYVLIDKQVANNLTKTLLKNKFLKFRKILDLKIFL